MSQRSRLIWRCRRGIREMDILLRGYLETHYDNASVEEKKIFEELLEETDLDILSWVTQKTSPAKKYVDLLRFIRDDATFSRNNSDK